MRTVRDDEAGFTLIEILVGTMVLGIVMAGIAGALFIGLKTTDRTTERLTESHDAQLIATYLVADLQSVAGGSIDHHESTSAASGCPGITWGANVLRLQWTEHVTAVTTYTAAYRKAVEGTGSDRRLELRRFYCINGILDRETTVATDLSPEPPQRPLVTVNGRRVSMQLTARHSGYTYTITGERRS